jgi:DNA-binding transcriptional ArsR family regulator
MDVHVISALGQALADPTRIQVLETIDGKLCVGEIAARVNVSSATASHHLATLQRGGLIVLEHRGRRHVPRRLPDVGVRLARALG